MTGQTIIEFITARLDEAEAAARAAGGDAWTLHDNYWLIEDSQGEVVVYDEGAPSEAQAAHIARHDPARILADVAAKRAILADHQIKPAAYPEDGDEDFGCERCYFDSDEGVYGFGYCPTLRHLAAIWSDHPDYRHEWSPA